MSKDVCVEGRASAAKNAMLHFVARVLIARQHDLCRTGSEAATVYRAKVDYGRRAVSRPDFGNRHCGAALSRAVNSIEFREQYHTLLIIWVSARNDRDAALRSAQIVGQMRHIGGDV